VLFSGSLCSPRASSSPLAPRTRDARTEPNRAGSSMCRPVWTGEPRPNTHHGVAHHSNHPSCARKRTPSVEVVNFLRFVAAGYFAFSLLKEKFRNFVCVWFFFKLWILLGLEDVLSHPYEGGFGKWKLRVWFWLGRGFELPFEGGFGNCVYGFGNLIWFSLGEILKLGILY